MADITFVMVAFHLAEFLLNFFKLLAEEILPLRFSDFRLSLTGDLVAKF